MANDGPVVHEKGVGEPGQALEGLALAAYAIGASKAYVYTRAEYPLAIARVTEAIAQATVYGLLGSNVFDSGFSLDIVVKQGAGAFVCGEETALIESLEGTRGEPRNRPPFPVNTGFRETVLMVSGSSARNAEGCKDRPVDAAIVGIVDTVRMDTEAETAAAGAKRK